MKFEINKKEQVGLLYENGAGEKIVAHSKLKLWPFLSRGQGEREWPLIYYITVICINYDILQFHVMSK